MSCVRRNWAVLFLTIIFITNKVLCLSTLSQFGAIGKQIAVATIDSFPDSLSFFNQHVFPQIPVLIKRGAIASPAYEIWRSDDTLLGDDENIGEAKKWMVTVEMQKKEDRKAPPVLMPFYDFLQTYKYEDQYLVEELPPYLARNAAMPYPLQCPEMAEAFLDAHVWFSAGGTKSVVHTDDADNILCLIDGLKELIIVDPHKYSEQVPIDVKEGSYSSINVDAVDLAKFPGLPSVEYIHANMSGGDCLYIPYRWIHQVRSYERNVAINIWWNHHLNKHFDLDKCDNLFDPAATLDKFKFRGFDSQLEHIEGVQALITEDLLEDGTITGANEVFDFVLGGFVKEMTESQIATATEYCEEMFAEMDTDGNHEVEREYLKTLSADGWKKIQKLLANIENLVENLEESAENLKTEL